MVDIKHFADGLTDKILKITVMPTEQCNFRCVYCYEDFLIGKMQRPVINGIKALLQQRLPELKYLTLDYFGGEPLIARDVVYEISNFAKTLIEQYYPEVKFFGQMTTNGFALKLEVFEKLLAVGVNSFQISLDGPREIHNKTRLRIDKSGSFDVIWKNLQSMRTVKQPFKVALRVHVTPENYTHLDELINEINKEFGTDSRFGVFFKAIENLGGPNAGTFATLTGKNKNELVNQFYQQLDQTKNFSPFENNKPYICYAAKPNNLVIRANGRIAKCTVLFNDERNDIGKINEDGTLEIMQQRLNLWTRGLHTREAATLNCPLHGLPQLKNIPITPN